MIKTIERTFLLSRFPDRELELKDEYTEEGNLVREYILDNHILKVIKDDNSYKGKIKSSGLFFIPKRLSKVFMVEITYVR